MKKEARRADETGFRWLLTLGAIVSVAIAVWGLVWTDMLQTVLGLNVPRRALGIARLYGGGMLAIGIGYGLAAAQPQRSRSLLVPLFVVPLVTSVSAIVGISRGEIEGGRGTIFVIYNVAYALLYFRLYPRVATEAPPVTPTSRPPGAPGPPGGSTG